MTSTELRQVFPASAGMNPVQLKPQCEYLGVPRERGDEPRILVSDYRGGWCSPRARG